MRFFKADALLKTHQRAEPPCPIRDEMEIEGFDRNQERLLRSRKRATEPMTEKEKWRAMYRILFPNDDPANTPSPCK
jgi:hypothetical protein